MKVTNRNLEVSSSEEDDYKTKEQLTIGQQSWMVPDINQYQDVEDSLPKPMDALGTIIIEPESEPEYKRITKTENKNVLFE